MSTAQINRKQNKRKVKLNETEKVAAVHRRIKEFFVTKLIQDTHDGGSNKLLQLKKYKELRADKVNHLYVVSHICFVKLGVF
jgi:urease gamma subunit